MFKWRKWIIFPLLIAALLLASGCGGGDTTVQKIEVTKGDLSLVVNGSGTVEAETEARPPFGTTGKVAGVYVEEGDEVKEGDVLAELETDNLELALSQALMGEAQARLSLTQAVDAKTQAETALASARFNLELTEEVAEIKDNITETQQRITIAEERLKEAQKLGLGSEDKLYWLGQLRRYQLELIEYQQELADLLSQDEYSGVIMYDIYGQKYDRATLEDIRIKQLRVESAELGVQQAEQNIEYARAALEHAENSVNVARNQLDNAIIKAPFSGTIVNVNIKEGEMASGLTPIYMIDSDSLFINATVDEIDVSDVEPGQKVIINLDSDQETDYEGKVQSISKAPVTNQLGSGIITYGVEVEFVNRVPDKVKLGMTANIDIITEENSDILVVPNRALNQDEEGNYYVNIEKDGTVEKRTVEIGVTDGIETEIVSGLSEGAIVVITHTPESGFFGQ
jgi:HlyD family secretion protein